MDIVRQIRVPVRLIRLTDFVPFGGWVVDIRQHRTGGLFPKSYVTLTFYTGEKYVDFTVEDHLPIDIERVDEQVAQNKEKK